MAVAYLVECAHHVAREIALPLARPGRAPDRLSRLLSQRLCRADHAADLHASQRRRGAAGLAGLRELRSPGPGRANPSVRPAGRDAGDPGVGRDAQPSMRRPRWVRTGAGRDSHASRRSRWASSELVVGTICGGSDATSGLTRQSGRRPGLRSAGRARAALPSSRKPAS